jgi:acetolactate synthase-1/2/3 large subunit
MEHDVAEKSGADILVETLLDLGVDTVFGYPGGAVLPIYDALYEHPKIKHILVRHEQAATHAAEGYARSTLCWLRPALERPMPSPALPTH